MVALDQAGSVVVSNDPHGSWVIYDARDVRLGPYESGTGPSADGYEWYGAFYGPAVADVKLTAINLVYSDGSEASFTAMVDLAQMFLQG